MNYYEGKADQAKAEMLTATQMDPTHVGVGIAYAQMLAWSGDIRAAIGEVSRLRRANPDWARSSAMDLAASWTKDPTILANIP